MAMADCTKNEYESCYGTPSEYLSEDAITIVQKWSDEHPVLTWEGKLRELLPNIDARSVCTALCPHDIFGGDAPSVNQCISDMDCACCWSGEYKEG